MTEKKLPKDISNTVGRTFALLFNRMAMYNMDHPITDQSLAEFSKIINQGLAVYSPIVIIMHQDQFFVEEEPLDSRINTSKMLQHFKKAGVNSVSYEKGLGEDELKTFAAIFIDTTSHVNADAMKKACTQQGVNKIKINHVFYTKVTENEEVVDRRELRGKSTAANQASGEPKSGAGMESIVEKMMMQELEKSLSLSNIISNPRGVSKQMIDAGVSAANEDPSNSAGSGTVIMQQLQEVRQQVESASAGQQKVSTQQLAVAVFDMKQDLLKGIEAQKAAGIEILNEAQIRAETDDIADKVLIQLVREEYQQGKITVPRMGQILRRLVPEPGELQRLMPKIKEALLEEGMPLADFLQLTQELKKELKSEELAHVLEKSAAEMGVSGDELIKEINRNPNGAAELIYLASEIRKGSGDEKVMSDLLVDYIERVGSQLTLDAAEKKGPNGEKQLHGIIAKIEKELLQGLKNKDVDTAVIHQVAQRLNERMEECTKRLESQWILRRKSYSGDGEESATTVLGVFDEGTDEELELRDVLDKVQSSVDNKDLDKDKQGEAESEKTTSPSQEETPEAEKPATTALPKGVLTRKSILYILKKEITRSMRYETPFSVLMLSVFKVTPEKQVASDSIDHEGVMNLVLEQLAGIFRDSDIIGRLDKNKILVILPMTAEINSRTAMSRILKQINDRQFEIDGADFTIKLAGSVTVFDQNLTPSLKEFIRLAENNIMDMIMRLKNARDIN
jgi:GGDEF domain-containing protein